MMLYRKLYFICTLYKYPIKNCKYLINFTFKGKYQFPQKNCFSVSLNIILNTQWLGFPTLFCRLSTNFEVHYSSKSFKSMILRKILDRYHSFTNWNTDIGSTIEIKNAMRCLNTNWMFLLMVTITTNSQSMKPKYQNE